MASGEPSAPGDETRAMAWPGACCEPEIPAAEHEPPQASSRPASCPSETIACRASQPALTTLLQVRTARPKSGGQERES